MRKNIAGIVFVLAVYLLAQAGLLQPLANAFGTFLGQSIHAVFTPATRSN